MMPPNTQHPTVLNDLPLHLLEKIMFNLDFQSMTRLKTVCKLPTTITTPWKKKIRYIQDYVATCEKAVTGILHGCSYKLVSQGVDIIGGLENDISLDKMLRFVKGIGCTIVTSAKGVVAMVLSQDAEEIIMQISGIRLRWHVSSHSLHVSVHDHDIQDMFTMMGCIIFMMKLTHGVRIIQIESDQEHALGMLSKKKELFEWIFNHRVINIQAKFTTPL